MPFTLGLTDCFNLPTLIMLVPKVVKSYSLEDPLFSTRYVARVMYDGTNFRGWQEQQPKLRTVRSRVDIYCIPYVSLNLFS